MWIELDTASCGAVNQYRKVLTVIAITTHTHTQSNIHWLGFAIHLYLLTCLKASAANNNNRLLPCVSASIFHRALMVPTPNWLHPKGSQIHLHDVRIKLSVDPASSVSWCPSAAQTPLLYTCSLSCQPVVPVHFFPRSCSSSLFLRPFSARTTFGFSLCCRSFPCNDVDLSILSSHRTYLNLAQAIFFQLHRWIGEILSFMHRGNLPKQNGAPSLQRYNLTTWFPSVLDRVPSPIPLAADPQEKCILFEKFESRKCNKKWTNLFDQSFRAPDKSTLQSIQYKLPFRPSRMQHVKYAVTKRK